MRVIVLLCLLQAVLLKADERVTYRGYQVMSVTAGSQDQVDTLNQLQEDNPEVVFFGQPAISRDTEMAVPPQLVAQVVHTMKQTQLVVTLVSGDMQADMDTVMAENEQNELLNNRSGRVLRNGRYSPPHNVYYRMDDVDSIMTNLANAYPDLAVRKQLPLMSELGRNIYYLELGTAGSNKPVIFIEGLAHAREWIVTASLIYSIDTMLSNYVSGDQHARDALNKYTWIIIPVVNPDGYIYTWTSNRLWRKNRKFIAASCTGVDLNRNFNVDFGNTGTSNRCSSDTYHGGSPFSEAETQNIAQVFDGVKSRVVSFLSVHAYSQLLLYPWGYVGSNFDPSPPANRQKLIDLGRLMQTALATNGRSYRLGTAYGVLGYAASGASEDWALQEKPGIFAYCYELRPATYNAGGFDIPASEIVPTGQELLASLYVLAERMDTV
eukprot:GHVL01018549.1.p1 GENE.GHVL01018549.1~~GHVL01018549.1.p1  ORF type:complete len:437 (+),score=19.45 GHVL01018549.1:92-1402(+)